MKSMMTLVVLALIASGCTREGSEPSTSGVQPQRAKDSAMHGETAGGMMSADLEKDMSMMSEMMVKTLGQQGPHYDYRFIDMMIPHHEGAIMMAKDALAHANKPELKLMAQNVITSQQLEIDQMKHWRAKWYGENTPNGMAISNEMKTHMQSMNDLMVEKLGQKDAGYENRFIDMMIPQHETAIAMAGDALGKATHPEIKKLGQDIIDAQKTEITQMEQWRKQW